MSIWARIVIDVALIVYPEADATGRLSISMAIKVCGGCAQEKWRRGMYLANTSK